MAADRNAVCCRRAQDPLDRDHVADAVDRSSYRRPRVLHCDGSRADVGWWVKILDDRGDLDGRTVGIVTGDADETVLEAVTDGLEAELERTGHPVTQKVVLPCSSVTCDQHDTAVERLRKAKVDFVFDALGPVSSPTFIAAADAAGYRPRYTFSSTLLNNTVAKFHDSVKATMDGMIGVGDYAAAKEGAPTDTTPFLQTCIDSYEKLHGERLSDDAAGMAGQGCVMLEIIKRGAEAVDDLGQDALVRGIESLGELGFAVSSQSPCTPVARPGSFGPGKHDAGNWLIPVRFDASLVRFLREEPTCTCDRIAPPAG